MTLQTLTLQDFRSYSKRDFSFTSLATLVVGANAAGKTNILEAIMLLATGRSFRAGVEREMIRIGCEIARIRADIPDGALELVLTPGAVNGKVAPRKKYLVHDVPRRMVDFVGNLRAVLFWPEDLEIITDSPSIRRRYLDAVLMQADSEYRRSLASYEKGLRQRNRLLDLIGEGKAHRSQLVFWNQLLIKAGAYITDTRATYLTFVNTQAFTHHAFQVLYDKSVISEARLDQYKDEEVAAKATLVGPHRDDFSVQGKEHGALESDFRDLSKYGSRGEQRLAVLWLKLSELSFIQHATGVRPILLLDDIFSELDEGHRALITKVVKEQQTIITSADIDSIPAAIRDSAQVLKL